MTTPAPRPHPTAPQHPTTAPPNPEMLGTDLPLPQRGSSGITAEHIEALLDTALDAVPAPPLNDTTRHAAYTWLRDVQAGLASRRERAWMTRRIIEALHAEQATAAAIERTRHALHRRLDAAEQQRAGTWWTDHDTRRRSQRPARFTVDDTTWQRHRHHARTAGIGLGEHLGAILTTHANNPTPHPTTTTTNTADTPTPRFIRIAIDDHTWTELKAAARTSHRTLTAHISAIITTAR